MTIDHIGVVVSNYEASKQFYTTVLAPLGIALVTEHDLWAGFGKNAKPEFWFGEGKKDQYYTHIAFHADSRSAVDDFYRIAIHEGAICNGKPKLRKDYYPDYYGVFVIDSDGHHIGAVFHGDEYEKD